MVRQWKRILQIDASSNSSTEFGVNSPTSNMFSNAVHSYTPSFHYLISCNLHMPASFKNARTRSLSLIHFIKSNWQISKCFTRLLLYHATENIYSLPISGDLKTIWDQFPSHCTVLLNLQGKPTAFLKQICKHHSLHPQQRAEYLAHHLVKST